MLQFSRSSYLIWDSSCQRAKLALKCSARLWNPSNSHSTHPSVVSQLPTQQALTLVRFTSQYSNKYTPKGSAMCVQRFDDSQSSAIRITYRISLRSSSFQEPRYPSWIVIRVLKFQSLSLSSNTQAGQLALARLPNLTNTLKWSFRRFTYGNLVTTSPSSKW